jgi:hypothetical protein
MSDPHVLSRADRKPSKSFDLRVVPKNLRLAEADPRERERLFFGKDFELFVLQDTRDRPLLDRMTADDAGLSVGFASTKSSRSDF